MLFVFIYASWCSKRFPYLNSVLLFSFLHSVLYILLFIFLSAIVLSVLLLFTTFDYLFGIFKLFLISFVCFCTLFSLWCFSNAVHIMQCEMDLIWHDAIKSVILRTETVVSLFTTISSNDSNGDYALIYVFLKAMFNTNE